MTTQKLRTPQKDAVKKLRERFERTKGKASSELLEILKEPFQKKEKQKKSARPSNESDAEV